MEKEVKVESMAIEEIKQEMNNILITCDPEQKGLDRQKTSAMRKEAVGRETFNF